jgi:pantetheine-phosphate adenylyltransferase
MRAIVTTSANPFHYGHLDLYDEGIRVFGKENVSVAIGKNANKSVNFNKITYHLIPYKINYEIAENITISDYCRNNNIDYLIRGIRNSVDAEYELKLDFLNKEINPRIQTVFFPTKEIFSNISSTSINELLKYNKYDLVKRYMNEDAMYRFVNGTPEFVVFFGKSCIGKTYYLENKFKNIIKVDNIFWLIFDECFGKQLRFKVQEQSKELIYGGKNINSLTKIYSTEKFWNTFFNFIRSNCIKTEVNDLLDLRIENEVYALDFAHIGEYWNTIPSYIRGKLYLINLCNSTKNRNIYVDKRGFGEKIKYLDKNYKSPHYHDMIINIENE